MPRIVQGDWCLTGALFSPGPQLAAKAGKWREKVFCQQFASFISSISTKELLIVSRKEDNT